MRWKTKRARRNGCQLTRSLSLLKNPIFGNAAKHNRHTRAQQLGGPHTHTYTRRKKANVCDQQRTNKIFTAPGVTCGTAAIIFDNCRTLIFVINLDTPPWRIEFAHILFSYDIYDDASRLFFPRLNYTDADNTKVYTFNATHADKHTLA